MHAFSNQARRENLRMVGFFLNFFLIVAATCVLDNFWRVIMEDNKKLYPMYTVWVPTQTFVTVLDPDDIQVNFDSE